VSSAAARGERGDVLDRIRDRCAEVARRARSVRIDADALARLADALAAAQSPEPDLDPAHLALGDTNATLAFVVSLDAINFGSGWFPALRKRGSLSGYRSIASAWREHCLGRPPLDAGELAATKSADCVEWFGQVGVSGAAELMGLYARALADLGRYIASRFGGDFAALVAAADKRPERLVELLAEMSLYRDVARYDELDVPFYKRAQITVSDLEIAFGGRGFGEFRELERLTLFADNLVPHVLRCEGVLVAAPELAHRIEAGELIAPGSAEEVELRACAVDAVERLVAALRERGFATDARALDGQLWNRGQRPEYKARPRHRTRCSYY
jgi:hypothetical protein